MITFRNFLAERSREAPVITKRMLKKFEQVMDRIFEKFGIDLKFTEHFRDRLNDTRNNPDITIEELSEFIRKVYKRQGKRLFNFKDAEAVLVDVQKDLNLPVKIKWDAKNDEIDVVFKTIMRKSNFGTSDPKIKY